MMNLNQNKLESLIIKLDLKSKEYEELCDILDKLNQNNIDPNDENLLDLKDLFQKNHDDIVEINRQIKELKNSKETM